MRQRPDQRSELRENQGTCQNITQTGTEVTLGDLQETVQHKPLQEHHHHNQEYCFSTSSQSSLLNKINKWFPVSKRVKLKRDPINSHWKSCHAGTKKDSYLPSEKPKTTLLWKVLPYPVSRVELIFDLHPLSLFTVYRIYYIGQIVHRPGEEGEQGEHICLPCSIKLWLLDWSHIMLFAFKGLGLLNMEGAHCYHVYWCC